MTRCEYCESKLDRYILLNVVSADGVELEEHVCRPCIDKIYELLAKYRTRFKMSVDDIHFLPDGGSWLERNAP